MGSGLTGENRRNEGTGLDGSIEGSFERQDWKDGITRDIRNLNRFVAIVYLFCCVFLS